MAALEYVDQVVLVLPERFPHKSFDGASLEQRAGMLVRLAVSDGRLGVAVAERGLFDDVAREALECFPSASVSLICGRDAAERILAWDYGSDDFVMGMLSRFRLLVADRGGVYSPPAHLNHAVRCLPMGNFDDFSSTLVRECIACGKPWRHLVPEAIHDLVAAAYPPG